MEFLFSLLVFPFFDVNTSVREELLLNYSCKDFFFFINLHSWNTALSVSFGSNITTPVAQS